MICGEKHPARVSGHKSESTLPIDEYRLQGYPTGRAHSAAIRKASKVATISQNRR